MVLIEFLHWSTVTFTFIFDLWAQIVTSLDSTKHVELLELGVLRCALLDFTC